MSMILNGTYASHMRDEANFIVDAVKETINVGRQAGVQVDISVSKMAFQNTKIGQNMTVEDHQGAFGIRFLTLPKE